MKLLSYNIWIKIDNTDRIWNFIKDNNFDIVLLQESMRHFDDEVFKKFKVDSWIREIVKYPYWFFAPVWYTDKMIMNWEIYLDFNGYVEQWNQILSKYPLLNSQNKFFYWNYELKRDWTDFVINDHSRAIQISKLDIDWKDVQIINIHGTYSKDKQDTPRSMLQCETILKIVELSTLPTIIAWDFNLFPDTKWIKLLNNEFTNLISKCNINSTRPTFKDDLDVGNNVVDYIFVNDKIKVNSFKIENTDISDHLPLILDFDIIN